jgi:hypothetical protein
VTEEVFVRVVESVSVEVVTRVENRVVGTATEVVMGNTSVTVEVSMWSVPTNDVLVTVEVYLGVFKY